MHDAYAWLGGFHRICHDYIDYIENREARMKLLKWKKLFRRKI